MSVKGLKGELILCNEHNERLLYSFFVFCFFFFEEKLCLRVAYFYWSKSEWSYSFGVKHSAYQFPIVFSFWLEFEKKKKENLNKVGEVPWLFRWIHKTWSGSIIFKSPSICYLWLQEVFSKVCDMSKFRSEMTSRFLIH